MAREGFATNSTLGIKLNVDAVNGRGKNAVDRWYNHLLIFILVLFLLPFHHSPRKSCLGAAAGYHVTTKDKKIELMVLTSTSHVAPHIAGCSSSVVINLTQVELQMVLISTVSTFLSFLSSSFSCLDLVHERPGSFSPPPSFTLRTAATTQGVTQESKQTTFPRSDRIERHAARGKGGEWAPGIAQDAAGERDDGAALASPPPSPRPAHQQQRKAGA